MEKKDFEAKLNDTKKILEKLNESDISLADSMKLYKQGQKTLKEASKMLEEAKLVLQEEEK